MSTRWTWFAIQRLLRLVGVTVALVVLTFMMVHLIPGDPARAIAGAQADPQAVERTRAAYGLDDPLWTQFVAYVENLAHLNLGESFQSKLPVTSVIAERLGPTAQIAFLGLAIVLIGGVIGGLLGIAAARRSRRGEQVFSFVTGLFVSLPHFVLATILIFLFALTWSVLPTGGTANLLAAVLPALAISIRGAALISRAVQVEGANAFEEDYVRTARSHRVSTTRIYVRHVLPNALTSALTLTGLVFASLVGGAIVVEEIFARPGLGSKLVDAILLRDYPVIQGIVLFLGLVIVVVNTLVDLLLGIVDPRTMRSDA